jgi:hypothetical protein
MNESRTRQAVRNALSDFAVKPLGDAALALFEMLGYRSEKRLILTPNTADTFVATFVQDRPLNREQAMLHCWRSVDFLFQLADEDIRSAASGRLPLVFDSAGVWNGAIIESYLFFAIDLNPGAYTRTELAGMTRAVNRLFAMPALLLFRHGDALTLAVIDRRLHRRDASKDVLEKVTLIKDIRYADPHRAHVDILADLAFDALHARYGFSHFVELSAAWRKTLDIAELNRKFYRELANWYFWAVDRAVFPQPEDLPDAAAYRAQSVIRLITRLIFAWFVKEKGLIPEDLFDERRLKTLLRDMSPGTSTYYKAILQNLFFATLNTEMNTPDKPDNRRFRGKNPSPGGRDAHFMVHAVYRYEDCFADPEAALALFAGIPFLNGGLFECLDKTTDTPDHPAYVRIDGFSDREDNPLSVPNALFFGDEQDVDLNTAYGTRGKRYRVRGLIHILNAYKFTIAENTPIEEEVALDPELLGQVFENLLAAYNPETGETARKQTGSFYTPREVVDYMVDEALIAYLETVLHSALAFRLRPLLAYNDGPHDFSEPEVERLIAAIDRLRILDPACGSGAFPMGVLHKLVHILGKLDPGNRRWKEAQLAKLDDVVMRDELDRVFRDNYDDYGRKLYLIQNAIYGVDIQPIAVQIAKLRFFISLLVDQQGDDRRENRGVRPLPNLETKFVAADALMGIVPPKQLPLRNPDIARKEQELAAARNAHFQARTQRTKQKYRDMDARLRAEIAVLLKGDGWDDRTARTFAAWDPYDQNAAADFFDPAWMFGMTDGFDIVIGNPPYVRQESIKAAKEALRDRYPFCYTGTADLYVYFFERAVQLLRDGGALAFISSNKYFRAGYGEKLRAYLAERLALRRLIDFGDAPVFTAIAYPSILIGRKALPDGGTVRALVWTPGPEIEAFPDVFAAKSFDLPQRELKADGWRIEGGAALRLLEKLRAGGAPLGEYVNGRFYRGILTGLNEAFVVDRAARDRLIAQHPSSAEVLKPFLRGRDVKRWRVEPQDLWLIFTRRGIDISEYPAIEEYLSQYKDRLMPGAPGARKPGSYKWYEIQDNIAYWQEFEREKIVYPDIAQAPEFTFDNRGFYLVNTLYLMPTDQLWLLGLLNSALIFWVYTKISTQIRGGFVRFIAQYVSQIPISPASAADQTAIAGLVERILALKRGDAGADVSDLEREIDERVGALFGLSAEERRMVEE